LTPPLPSPPIYSTHEDEILPCPSPPLPDPPAAAADQHQGITTAAESSIPQHESEMLVEPVDESLVVSLVQFFNTVTKSI
jgi:hypothetical protein